VPVDQRSRELLVPVLSTTAAVNAYVPAPDYRSAAYPRGLRLVPAAFGRFIAAETAKWGKAVKEAGIRRSSTLDRSQIATGSREAVPIRVTLPSDWL
jgi:hypothetical protein